ncbi:MAG: hypothetical protein M3P30_06505 [Chloroflexota bacterium]|nr:hypothetical protein [Chloroflexota bacterium]
MSIVSTAVHYSHNYVEIAHYPASSLASSETIRLLILVVWPTLTAIGLLGYWLYARHAPGACACLMLYSILGLVTLGHFTSGSPHIPPFFYATIFTDAAAGVAVLAFAAWFGVASAAPEDRAPR